MRRFLPAAVMAILIVAVASPVNAGYLIIRVILEGASGSGAGPGELGMGMPGGGMTSGSVPLPASGQPPLPASGRPPGGASGDMSTPGGTPAGGTHKHDPSRSLVVVVPIEEELGRVSAFYPKLAANHYT